MYKNSGDIEFVRWKEYCDGGRGYFMSASFREVFCLFLYRWGRLAYWALGGPHTSFPPHGTHFNYHITKPKVIIGMLAIWSTLFCSRISYSALKMQISSN